MECVADAHGLAGQARLERATGAGPHIFFVSTCRSHPWRYVYNMTKLSLACHAAVMWAFSTHFNPQSPW